MARDPFWLDLTQLRADEFVAIDSAGQVVVQADPGVYASGETLAAAQAEIDVARRGFAETRRPRTPDA